MNTIDRLRQLTRGSRNRPERKVLILLYHQVTELRSDPWLLSVTPDHFAQHLKVLRQHAHPLRLQQLPHALREGNLPDRSVIITFDDGYADNLHNAKPILEHYDVPATVFLATGYIGKEREFWWDELDRLLLQPGVLPGSLSLNVKGSTYRWKLGEAAHYTDEALKRHHRWRAWEEAPSSRHSLYSSLWNMLRPMIEDERQRVLNELRRWAGAEPAGRPSHRPLSLEEVGTLAKGGLVEIGAHTVTHPSLAALPPALQQEEIMESKARLEDILTSPVTSFSYPYGWWSDYTGETVSIVREAGFTCACSNFRSLVEPSTDPFQLPRIQVRNWEGEKFARRLSRWFSDPTVFARSAGQYNSPPR